MLLLLGLIRPIFGTSKLAVREALFFLNTVRLLKAIHDHTPCPQIMSSSNPGTESDIPAAARRSLIYSMSSAPELEWLPEMDAPPAYTEPDDPPPYWQPRITAEDTFRFDESKGQQEIQLLVGVLFSIMLTVVLMEALPMLGQPTCSTHAIRIYGWFTLAFFLSFLLAFVSLLCKSWMSHNHPSLLFMVEFRSPETRLQRLTKSVANRLIASGPVIMYAMTLCFGVGLVDFFWQLYPTLGMWILTIAVIYGSGPVLASLSQKPFKVPLPPTVQNSWQVARTWSTGATPRTTDLQEQNPPSIGI
ncbi:hypothetical protein DFH06DRAFT_1211412 [Mycena polygramma]|nr:hypothetical protein DFH06DRAFT_1211412 [Mycena polygramma]